MQVVPDDDEAGGGDGCADRQAAVALAVDGAQHVKVLGDRPVDAVGLRPSDHDAAFDPLTDVQLGVAEAHPEPDERVLVATVHDDVGAEAPPRPARDALPNESSETLACPLSWNAPVAPLKGCQRASRSKSAGFSNTRSPGSVAVRRVTGRPSQSDSAWSSSAVVPSGRLMDTLPSSRYAAAANNSCGTRRPVSPKPGPGVEKRETHVPCVAPAAPLRPRQRVRPAST